MVLHIDIDINIEKRLRAHVFTKDYKHGDLSRITTTAIEFYLDAHEDKPCLMKL